jgi:PTH1 family peptidyl-tRNA hydrolase
MDIKAIIGLGNPGQKYSATRHNIGFKIVDALADKYHGRWQAKPDLEYAEISLNGKAVILIKPQTFMNSSGKVVPFLAKQGIKPEQIIVAHDELELPFGQIKMKLGGSAKGHNGLKSIIAACGDQFHRLRFGISRPENKEDVPDYVLKPFKESEADVARGIEQAIEMLEKL